jgi:hypothetical protein
VFVITKMVVSGCFATDGILDFVTVMIVPLHHRELDRFLMPES